VRVDKIYVLLGVVTVMGMFFVLTTSEDYHVRSAILK
jgi:hypothetical protein